MMRLSRYLAPAALAASLGVAAVVAPAPAQAQSDDLVRVLVNVADVVLRGNQPYYRHGNYDYGDRLVMQRDRYGHPVYYRYMPRDAHRQGPRYRNDHGYYRNRGYPVTGQRSTKCNKHGKCKVEYYDPRYDRDGRNRYGSYDSHDDRYRDGDRWRDRD